jgi:hypothetical protein
LYLEEILDEEIVATVNEEQGGLPVTMDDWLVWMGMSVDEC